MARGHRNITPEELRVAPAKHQQRMPAPVKGTVRAVLIENAVPLFTHTMGNALASTFTTGAIMRVIPLPEASAVEREAYREELIAKWGAKHVWFTAAASKARVLTKRAARPPTKVESVNEAVEAMLATVRSKDPKLLRAIVENALSKAGS